MPIIDLETPALGDTLDTPKGFVVTPGEADVNGTAPTWGKTFGAAFRQDNTVGSFLSSENVSDARDDSFNPWDDIKGTKYEANFESFADVRNRGASDAMKRKIDQENDDRKLLDGAPWYQSLVSQAAAGGLDLPTLLPGGAFIKGAKGGFSVAKSAASVGAAAGVSSAVQEAALQNMQETRTAGESAVNIGASVLLGGLLGAGGAKLLSPGEWASSVAKLETAMGDAPPIEIWRSAPADRSTYIDSKAYQASLHAPYEAADGTKLASSKTVPFEGPLPEVGTWRMDPRSGNYGHEIEVLNKVKIDDVDLPEVRDGKLDPTKQGDDIQYAQWLEEGRRAPPIEVIQRDDGTFAVIDGHRRALAAKMSGADEIEAWISYAVPTGKTDTNGKPIKTSLTYELVHKGDTPSASGSPASVGAAANSAATLASNTIAGRAASGVASATAQMNPALRALTSPSAAYREEATKLFENSLYLKKNADGVASEPAVETLMKEWNAGLATAVQNTEGAFSEYVKANGGGKAAMAAPGRFGLMTRSEFREEVGKAMRRGDVSDNPQVAKVAAEWRAKVFEPLKKAAIETGLLPADVSVDTATSYFSRMWNRNRLVAEEGRFKTVVQDWVAQESPKWADQFDKGVERRLNPLQREIDELEMSKLRRGEELKRRDDDLDTSEMSEGDIRQALRIVDGKIPRPKGVKTLSQFVLESGGLVDDAGELAHRGITNKARPGLVRAERRTAQSKTGGWTLDDMARHAWENGYFPESSQRPSIDHFVEALNDDFHKVRAVLKHGDQDAFKLNDMVAQLEADLSRAGVKADGKAPRFSTSEEMKGAVARVYKALDAEADRKIAALKDRLAERSADARVDRESRFVGDPKELGRQIADEVFDSLTGKAGDGPRPEFITIKARGPLKERTFNIPDHLVEDFLESDVDVVGRRYARVMGADVEMARKFGSVDLIDQIGKIREDYKNLRAAATTEKERLALDKREGKDIKDLEAMRDMLRGNDPVNKFDGNFGNIARSANHLNYLRQMGEVALASLSETVRPAMVHGLMPYMQTIGQLATNMKGIKMSVAEAKLAGNVVERALGQRLATLSDIADPYASRGPVEAFLENMTNVASKWNGIRLLTDMQKSIASVMTQDRILKNAEKYAEIKPTEKRYMAYLGIDQSMAERIAKQMAEHGETVEGVKVAGTEKWTDEVARRTYRAAINKDVDSIITTRSVADVPLFASTPTGRMLLQFKSFALASHQRVLLRGLQEDKTRFVGGLLAMSMVGMMTTWLKAVSGNRTEKLQEISKNPGWWVSEGLDRSGILSVPMELANTFEKATGFNPIKTPMKSFDEGAAISQKNQNRNKVGSLLGPSFGMASDALDVAGIPQKVIKGEEVTKADKNAAERLIPFNSYLGMRQILKYGINPPQ